jgi:hypothetical protein
MTSWFSRFGFHSNEVVRADACWQCSALRSSPSPRQRLTNWQIDFRNRIPGIVVTNDLAAQRYQLERTVSFEPPISWTPTDVLIQFDRPKARELGLDPTPEKRRRY